MSEFKSKKLDSDVWTKAINALYKYESIQQSSKGQATSKLPLLSSYSKPIFAQVTKWWISIDCLIPMDCNSIFMINLGTVEFRDKALSDKTHQNHHPSFLHISHNRTYHKSRRPQARRGDLLSAVEWFLRNFSLSSWRRPQIFLSS